MPKTLLCVATVPVTYVGSQNSLQTMLHELRYENLKTQNVAQNVFNERYYFNKCGCPCIQNKIRIGCLDPAFAAVPNRPGQIRNGISPLPSRNPKNGQIGYIVGP